MIGPSLPTLKWLDAQTLDALLAHAMATINGSVLPTDYLRKLERPQHLRSALKICIQCWQRSGGTICPRSASCGACSS
ncbi:hypothetical protein BD626DRAFT_111869 [Schizophyllum amplum]|uniref:Uncharacterized protein n=1 Tax=Schizophyllum amplum TaxID=97359 RepID=A0A550CTM8_9AGAR|nr:hypothetical protein BD626DRAFT_111869 [Auriculariopsis ampla]